MLRKYLIEKGYRSDKLNPPTGRRFIAGFKKTALLRITE
jgi:hypothetical protein